MKAGKAYISSLGTTGLLITSSLLLLVVVGALVAYDRWPTGGISRAETVAITGAERTLRAPNATDERDRARAAGRRRAAAERRRDRFAARRTERRAAEEPPGVVPPGGPLISTPPAPGASPSGGGSAGSGGRGARPGGGSGGGSAGGGDPSGSIADAVATVSPQAGQAVGGVGQAIEAELNAALGADTAP